MNTRIPQSPARYPESRSVPGSTTALRRIICSLTLLILCSTGFLTAQNCTPVPLVSWPIDTCAAFAHAYDYTELTPTYPNLGGCGQPSATHIYRTQGGHSCNPGPSSGDGFAFCVGGFTDTAYVANSPEAVRFQVTYPAGSNGRISGLTFQQTATNPTQYINSAPVNNNYPTLYGLRVLKSGVEIFRQIGQSTDTSWTLESFTFAASAGFSFNATTTSVTYEFELFAYAPVGNGYSASIWDLDDFTLSGCCQAPCNNATMGGTIGTNQSSCGPFDPAPLTSITPASGGSGAIEYLWLAGPQPSWGGSTVIPNQSGPTYDPPFTTTTTYYRRCARRAGCTTYIAESNWICIEVFTPPTVNCFSTDVTCNMTNNGTASAVASGGSGSYTYQWSNGATTAQTSGLSPGTYSVIVTDANGCADTCATFVGQQTPMIITLTGTDPVCAGGASGSATVNIAGGTPSYSYQWSNGQTTQTITGLTAGTYTVGVTDTNGCYATGYVQLNDPPALGITASGTDPTCNGGNDGSVTAQASGGTAPYSYLWSNGATTGSVFNLGAGTYTLVVTDANGCTAATAVSLNAPSAVAVNLTGTNISCNEGTDGTATAVASGGTAPYTYLWASGATGATRTGLPAGTYTVQATDANGCLAYATITLTEPTPVSATLTGTDISCNGGNDGTATAVGSGGTAPYSYNWNNGQMSATATGLNAGNYTVTVTDANGCTGGGSVTLGEPTALTLTTSSTDDSCALGTGTATATASGGTAPYGYSWSDGQTSATATGLNPGAYTVTVTDANGCTVNGITVIGTNIPTDTCDIDPGSFRTQTQGGWGASCNANNPGCYRDANFAGAFPTGLTIGCTNTLTLTNSLAVMNYLPCGGPPAVLTQSYTNPTCIGNVLVSQLIAATLSVQFDLYDPNFGSSAVNLIDLVVTTGPMAGLTVGDVLVEANSLVGGCGSTYSLGDVNATLTSINQNFIDGTQAGSALGCPDPCNFQSTPTAPRPRTIETEAWPNPFSDLSHIQFTFPEGGQTELVIYSLAGGKLIQSRDLGELPAGTHYYTWDGTNNAQRPVARGMYLVRVQAGDQVGMIKVIRQ